MILLALRQENKWVGDVMRHADAATILSVGFNRPDGTVARLQWPIMLAARGDTVDALKRVAHADLYCGGAYLKGKPPGVSPCGGVSGGLP
jgi:hypothetical protein